MKFLDAHIHLWQRSESRGVWLHEKIAGLSRDFTEDDFREERTPVNVGAAIVVQAAHDTEEAVKWLERAKVSDQIAGVIGWADLYADDLAQQVGRLAAYPHFAGLRPLPPDTFGGEWLNLDKTRRGLTILQDIGCATDILIRTEKLPDATALFTDYPELRLCLNHAARPAVMTGILEPWASDIQRFARETNAVVKCSGLLERAGIEWSKDSVRPYVETVIEAFGTKRVMFATNWPVLNISATYGGWVRTLTSILDDLGLSQEERDDIMWRTASRFYGIPWPE